MSEPLSRSMPWIRAGAALSLGALALSVLGRRRRAARLSARAAGAFLEAWGDLRLETRVARLLARAEGGDPAGKAEAARPAIEALLSGRVRDEGPARRGNLGEEGIAGDTPSRHHPEPK